MATPTTPTTDMQVLFTTMAAFVTSCMSSHDPSHNPAHVYRVVTLARRILASEQQSSPTSQYDPYIIDLAALLHDIGDRKYTTQIVAVTNTILPGSGSGTATAPYTGGSSAKAEANNLDPKRMVQFALQSHGADPILAEKVQTIVSHVSYTVECADPHKIRTLIDDGYPELAIVQDADRLDALGALGIGRCFTFLGAQGAKLVPQGGDWEMKNAIDHFGDKLERLEGMMKTETGRDMARLRTQRLKEFRDWWDEEISMATANPEASL